MRRLLVALGLVLAVSVYAAPNASATDLNIINCNCLPNGATDGGTVTIVDNGATLTFTVDLNNLLNFHYTNAFDLFTFNYSGTGQLSLLGAVTAVGGGSTTGWTLEGPGTIKMDGAGQSFDYGIICSTCSAPGGLSGVNTITFTIQLVGGTLNTADVQQLEDNNAWFAAAVARTDTGGGCTGVISGGGAAAKPSTGAGSGSENCGGATVPDGGTTVGLLGLGMLGLGYLRRRLA